MVKRGCLSFVAVLLLSVIGYAQKSSLDAAQADGSVRVVVVVADKSGSPVADLAYEDFRLFDNDAVRPIRSFRVIRDAQPARQALLFVSRVRRTMERVFCPGMRLSLTRLLVNGRMSIIGSPFR
jgi:hypothetical protein